MFNNTLTVFTVAFVPGIYIFARDTRDRAVGSFAISVDHARPNESPNRRFSPIARRAYSRPFAGILLVHAVSAALKTRPKFKIATTSTTTTSTTTEEPHAGENENASSEVRTQNIKRNYRTIPSASRHLNRCVRFHISNATYNRKTAIGVAVIPAKSILDTTDTTDGQLRVRGSCVSI